MNFNESLSTSFDTSVCGLLECEFSTVPNSLNFEVLSTETTSDACANSGDQEFENLYFNFFQPLTTYNYSIGCLLSGDACFLTIFAPNGDEANFWNGLLTTTTSKNKEIDVSIYPNPVKNELFISSSNNNLKNNEVEVYDLLGKLRISQTLSNSKSIHVEDLSIGVYMLRIKDDSGNTTTQKFVKI
ncbi:T9SS type A sorting domain-containing protein [uncultured Algibacter sp.]|uniref:T9SS type A sorting domain-containing protein n=1 Tax=uncultured Algibacter sp. TaxID=298659 RepID=UPI002618532E|nr:T9SS type A sorting domain-containing protein [uncultured Algibacter sp.]